MDITRKRIAVLVHNYFEQIEFTGPIAALKDAGGTVVVVGADTAMLHGMHHAEPGNMFTADVLLSQAKPEDYDALVVPGGVINADHLRVVAAAKQWVFHFLDSGKPLACICHAPWLLVSADAVEGHRLTGYYTIKDDVVNAGGEWVDQPVVVDDNLITSRKPEDLPQFNDALLRALDSSGLHKVG